jgi:hypothetical protein
VAMVVVLCPVSDDEPRVEPAVLEELAQLGITSVALLRDPSGAGLVLEGWSFDPRDAQRAARAFGGAGDGIRMLQPLAHLAVSSTPFAGTREKQKGVSR